MRKFLSLCVLMSLIFFFTMSTLVADVNKVDLGSNLSFTFESSITVEKPLTIIPFANSNLSLLQEKHIEEVKKFDSLPAIFAIGVAVVTIICFSQGY